MHFDVVYPLIYKYSDSLLFSVVFHSLKHVLVV